MSDKQDAEKIERAMFAMFNEGIASAIKQFEGLLAKDMSGEQAVEVLKIAHEGIKSKRSTK